MEGGEGGEGGRGTLVIFMVTNFRETGSNQGFRIFGVLIFMIKILNPQAS